MIVWKGLAAAALATLALAVQSASPAGAQADDFKGKQITIVVGYGPGGGYDLYTRLLSRHLGKHLPGNPGIVIQHMPGAGSLRAANHIYNVAPKDGTVLGVFSAPTALEPLFGNESAKFETVKFAWIGNMYRDVASCGTWHNSGFNSFQDLLNSKSEIAFGASGPGTPGNQHALVLRSMMGMKLRVITGYTGIADVGLALSRNEVQAACALFSSTVKASFMRPLKDGELKILVQFGRKNDPVFGDATNFYSLLKTDEQRQVADLFFGQSEISRPIIGPPGMPGPVISALRAGMANALKDPALLADAAKLGVDVDPVSGEETERSFVDFYKVPAPVLQRAREIMGRK